MTVSGVSANEASKKTRLLSSDIELLCPMMKLQSDYTTSPVAVTALSFDVAGKVPSKRRQRTSSNDALLCCPSQLTVVKSTRLPKQVLSCCRTRGDTLSVIARGYCEVVRTDRCGILLPQTLLDYWNMDKLAIGLRTQDFHEGLREIRAYGPKEAHFGNTLLIGKAGTLAMHLRGLLYIDNYTVLKYAAGQLGIGALELPAVLHELEEVDFVSVKKTGERVQRVDIRVPEFRDGYEDLGRRWEDLGPSEIEQVSVDTLHSLLRSPIEEEKLVRSLAMKPQEYAILRDVMENGQLVRVQTLEGEKIVYTPLAVDGNPTKYLQWAGKFPAQVSSALKILSGHQGLPVSDSTISSNVALQDAVMTGVLAPVTVAGSTGVQEFLFAPRGGLAAEERVILDKARAILACVRYGQKFAAGRPILYPKRILESLRDRKRFRRGHPDLCSQYGVLVEKLIGYPVQEGSDHWNFVINDTPENMKAFDIAISLLEIGESPSARINLEARNALLGTTNYLSPPSTRARLARSFKGSPETQAEIIRQLSAIGRGMTI